MSTVFILGAGASCEKGPPLVRDVLETALNKIQVKLGNNSYSFGTDSQEMAEKHYMPVLKIIDDVYETNLMDVYNREVKKGVQIDERYFKNFTSFRFEKFLSTIDECINNKRGLKAYTSEKLEEIRPYLRYIIFYTLSDEAHFENGAGEFYKNFIKNKIERNDKVFIISLNYDTLLEVALSSLSDYSPEGGEWVSDVPWSYDTDFDNIDSKFCSYQRKGKHTKLFILKPHGSFNWVYCNNCLETTLYGPFFRYDKIGYFACPSCKQNKCEHILLPPSHFKDASQNKLLNNAFDASKKALNQADKVIIVGYSLPEEDRNVLDLLRNSFSAGKKPGITVVNTEIDDIKRIKSLLKDCYCSFEAIQKNFSEYVMERE